MSEVAMREVNTAVLQVLTLTQPSSQQRSPKWKDYSVFGDKQKATIDKYTVGNSTAAVINKILIEDCGKAQCECGFALL